MRLKWIIVIVAAVFMINTACAEIVYISELEDDLKKQLYEIAIKEADILGRVLQDKNFIEEHAKQYLPASYFDALVDYEYKDPATAVFFLSNNMFDKNSVSSGRLMPLSSVCFDFMYEVNNLYSSGEFAEFSSRISIYGCEDISGFKDMAYVVLVYSKDGPQIVVAFCEDDNGLVLTKASFIYNPNFIHTFVDDGNATFPFVISQTWDECFDEYVYRIR